MIHESGHVSLAKKYNIRIYRVQISHGRFAQQGNYIQVKSLKPPCFNSRLIKERIQLFLGGVVAERVCKNRKVKIEMFESDFLQALEYSYAYFYNIGMQEVSYEQARRLVKQRERAVLQEFKRQSSRARLKRIINVLCKVKRPLAMIQEMH